MNWDLVCVQLETILKIRILDEPEKCKSKNPSSSSPHAAFLPQPNVQVAFKSLSLHQCGCQKLEAIIVKALSAVYEMACAQGSYSDQFLHYTLDAPTCLSSRGTSMKQDKEFTLQNAGLKVTRFGLFCNLRMGQIRTYSTVGYFNLACWVVHLTQDNG